MLSVERGRRRDGLGMARLDDDDVAAIGDALAHGIIEGGERGIERAAIAVRAVPRAAAQKGGRVADPEDLSGIGLEDGDAADGDAAGKAVGDSCEMGISVSPFQEVLDERRCRRLDWLD
jgi:hypothetical protein